MRQLTENHISPQSAAGLCDGGTILDSRALFRVGGDWSLWLFWCGVISDYSLPGPHMASYTSRHGVQLDGQFLLAEQADAVHVVIKKASDAIWGEWEGQWGCTDSVMCSVCSCRPLPKWVLRTQKLSLFY